MAAHLTADQLERLAQVARDLDPGGRFLIFEVSDGYDGPMKEHNRCARMGIPDSDYAGTIVRRYGVRGAS